MKDSRFNPVEISEVPKMKLEISLLSKFENINDPLDFLPDGTHGIEIEFLGPAGSKYENKKFRGTYLPNVMPE